MDPGLIIHVPADPQRSVDHWGDEFSTRLKQAARTLDDPDADTSRRRLRIPLGLPGKAPALANSWWQALLPLARGGFSESLSITTHGLHTEQGLLERARELGVEGFVVADGDPTNAGVPLPMPAEATVRDVRLAPGFAGSRGLVLTGAVRPFAHAGFGGSVFRLGCGLLTRESKIRLHQGLRPTVDTPLCAGCGSCLSVCVFDAIGIHEGRATIDHHRCTGCGQCMTACHLAGISPRDEGALKDYQAGIARSAAAAHRYLSRGPGDAVLFVNFLTPRHTREKGFFHTVSHIPSAAGALLSRDPVALDQATWDLLVPGMPEKLRQWSGFPTNPGIMLEEAQAQGLGSRTYQWQESA